MTPPLDRAAEPETGGGPAPAAGRPASAPIGRAVDVILPVHNERAQLERSLALVTAFAAATPDYHFAFVADGSTDGAPALIRAHVEGAGLPNLELLAYAARRGKGHAIRIGVEHARAGSSASPTATCRTRSISCSRWRGRSASTT